MSLKIADFLSNASPAGETEGVIESVEYALSKKKNTPYIGFKIKKESGGYAFISFYKNDVSFRILMRALSKLGFEEIEGDKDDYEALADTLNAELADTPVRINNKPSDDGLYDNWTIVGLGSGNA
jgi:hypothetical protein